MLVNYGIEKSRENRAYDIFTNEITSDFLNDPTLPMTLKPSEYVRECWGRYEKYREKKLKGLSKSERAKFNKNNGSIFEDIIITLFVRENISPLYYQAKAKLVPDTVYDVIMYDEKDDRPITISFKASSRERYKQAEFEGEMFKNVHRFAINYLFMLGMKDCISIRRKVEQRKVIGIDYVIQADSNEMDDFITELKERKLGQSPIIQLFDGRKI